jgi:hypothetical protein
MASKLQEQYDAILKARLLVSKEMARTANKNNGVDTDLLDLGEPLLDAAETIKSLMKLIEFTKSE